MKSQTNARNEVRTEEWLRDLPQLLEERHGVPRLRAAELTHEAANHLTATGRAPHEEFELVELYALKLAEQEAGPRTRWWMRSDIQMAIGGVILAGYLLSSLVSGGPAWQTALAASALAVDLALLTADVLRKRSARASRQ
ncbi:hypothetical protein ACFT8W_14670 [Streptomyces hygroscopicus]|uniref:hypothetical protein n=1 Tax=Streptomyces hygroscopicus TaxID=1912 RepID=UPI0036266CDF